MPFSLIPDRVYQSIYDIDPTALRQAGVTLLLADLDNTLAKYGQPEPDQALPFCHEVMRECSARGFDGVICAFRSRPLTVLGQIVSQLGELMHKRGWPLYVPEA